MSVELPEPLPGESGLLETAGGNVRWYADGRGKPVVILHSFNAAGSAYEVRPIYRALARDRRAIAFDWPGFGRSDRPDVAYDAELFEEVLDAFLEAVATGRAGGARPAEIPEPLDVIALSLPSQYVAVLAEAEPDRFGRLVLVSPTGFGRFGGRPTAVRRLVWRLLRSTGLGALLFAVLARRRIIRLFLRQIYADPTAVPRDLVEYSWRTSQQAGASRAPLRFICGLLDDGRAAEAYRRLRVPALLLFGTSPRFTDPAAARDLVSTNPSLRMVEIEASGDLPQWERPEETIAAIEGFLAESGAAEPQAWPPEIARRGSS